MSKFSITFTLLFYLLFINDKFAKNQDSTIIKRALNIFNNDSFWLVAHHKLYDKIGHSSY